MVCSEWIQEDVNNSNSNSSNSLVWTHAGATLRRHLLVRHRMVSSLALQLIQPYLFLLRLHLRRARLLQLQRIAFKRLLALPSCHLPLSSNSHGNRNNNSK